MAEEQLIVDLPGVTDVETSDRHDRTDSASWNLKLKLPKMLPKMLTVGKDGKVTLDVNSQQFVSTELNWKIFAKKQLWNLIQILANQK